jgi:aryl-alcohol dehydrogenase (NADP+)
MKFTKLGSSGTVVSKIALGSMYFGDETPQDEAFAILDAFLEAGGNLIDTANVYAGNRSEEIIGRWLASRPKEITDLVVLATKGRSRNGPDVNDAGLSRRHLQRALNGSLRRLGVETIDLYQLHASDMHTPMEETLAFLDDAVSAGKILYVGLSNFTGWQLQLFVSTAKAMGIQAPVTLQPQYSLLSREIEWEIVPAALYNGLGLLPWSPLAGGFLTGKYQRATAPATRTRAGSQKTLYQWTSEEYAQSWLMHRPGVTAPIVGARTLKHLSDNLKAVDVTLDAATTEALDAVSAPTPGGYPYGAFGAWQRGRELKDGSIAPPAPFAGGSDRPTGTPVTARTTDEAAEPTLSAV